MDSLFLTKLPPEIRLRIYESVYDCSVDKDYSNMPKIRILVADVAKKSLITYRFNRKCGLTFTCRLIKAESWGVMWRSALVSVHAREAHLYHTYSCDAVILDELNKVLSDDIAQNITYLSTIKMALLQRVQNGSCESMSTSLLKYPRLKACYLDLENSCFDYRKHLYINTVDDMDAYEYAGLNCEGYRGIMDVLLPFELTSGKKPLELLEELFGLGMKPDGVQILVLTQLDSEYGFWDPPVRL